MARAMKDSGVEWIGEIPEEWEVYNIRHEFSFGKGLPITKEDLRDNGEPVISYGQIHSKINTGTTIKPALVRYVEGKYLDTHPDSLAHKGDLIVADTSEDIAGCGNCIYVDTDAPVFAGYHTIILRNKTDHNQRYLSYLFQTDAWRSQIRKQVTGVKLFSISQKILRSTSVIIPQYEEQQRISDFLDTECARIDAVIEQTRASIEEYKKLKQSVITQAVTNGIRPGRKMKDSGVEWIGEIPEEWTVFRIASLYDERNERGTEDLPILTVSINTGISDHEIPDDEKSRVFVRSEDRTLYKRVCPGDLAYNMMRAWQGAFGAVRVEGMVSPAYVVAKPMTPGALDSRYVEALLRTPSAIEEMHRYSRGITDFRLRLYWPEFKNICVCVPSVKEQIEIADYIDAKTAEIDTLIQKKQQFLDEMESYKKSLIFEYVTGKKEVI